MPTNRHSLPKGRNFCKQILMGKKSPEQSMEAFRKYYLEQHAPLIMKTIPQARKYTVNFVVERPGKESAFDFVTEVWWDDLAAARAFYKSDAYRHVIRPDELSFGITGLAAYFEEFVQR